MCCRFLGSLCLTAEPVAGRTSLAGLGLPSIAQLLFAYFPFAAPFPYTYIAYRAPAFETTLAVTYLSYRHRSY
ncbi:hypothetical protein EDB80DRAFT_243480 [Ilyonectria destructans]|nr:hypothetical protein EDB80DRAFT_243480 [Ilyonectria destructans]